MYLNSNLSKGSFFLLSNILFTMLGKYFLESFAELNVEDGVDGRIETAVDVTKPGEY